MSSVWLINVKQVPNSETNLEQPTLKDRSNRASRYHVSQIFDAANDATTYRDLIKRNEFFFFRRGSPEQNPSKCWRCGLSFLRQSRVNFGRWTCKEMCTHFPPFVQQCQCSSVSLFRFSPGGKHHHPGRRKNFSSCKSFDSKLVLCWMFASNSSPAPKQCRLKVLVKMLNLLIGVDILKRLTCTFSNRRAPREEKFCTKVSHDYGFAHEKRGKRRPERLRMWTPNLFATWMKWWDAGCSFVGKNDDVLGLNEKAAMWWLAANQ